MSRLASQGELRARVTLEAPDNSVDDAGALVRVWRPVADVWAKIAPRRGAELYIAGEQETMRAYDVVVRWRADLASPMRFRMGARALFIRAAFDPDGRKQFLVCACEEFSA